MTRTCELSKDAVISRILSTGQHVGDADPAKEFWMIQAYDVLKQHFEMTNTNIFFERLNPNQLLSVHIENSVHRFPSVASFRDADGDVDTCPMWTFPTVRPTSMNKLQKGYTHTDSEVRPRSGQLHTSTYYFLFS